MIGAKGFTNYRVEPPNLMNQTGAALTQDGVYCLDELKANTNTSTSDDQADNVVAVASGNVLHGTILIAKAATATATRGRFEARGFTNCRVLGDSGQAVGTALVPVAGQTYLASASTNTNCSPVALVYTPNTNATVTTVPVKFDGITPR